MGAMGGSDPGESGAEEGAIEEEVKRESGGGQRKGLGIGWEEEELSSQSGLLASTALVAGGSVEEEGECDRGRGAGGEVERRGGERKGWKVSKLPRWARGGEGGGAEAGAGEGARRSGAGDWELTARRVHALGSPLPESLARLPSWARTSWNAVTSSEGRGDLSRLPSHSSSGGAGIVVGQRGEARDVEAQEQ